MKILPFLLLSLLQSVEASPSIFSALKAVSKLTPPPAVKNAASKLLKSSSKTVNKAIKKVPTPKPSNKLSLKSNPLAPSKKKEHSLSQTLIEKTKDSIKKFAGPELAKDRHSKSTTGNAVSKSTSKSSATVPKNYSARRLKKPISEPKTGPVTKSRFRSNTQSKPKLQSKPLANPNATLKSKPNRKPRTRLGNGPATKHGKRPEAKLRPKLNPKPTVRTRRKPTGNSSSKSKAKSKMQPQSKPRARPGIQSASKEAEKSGAKPKKRPTAKPAFRPASQTAIKSSAKPVSRKLKSAPGQLGRPSTESAKFQKSKLGTKSPSTRPSSKPVLPQRNQPKSKASKKVSKNKAPSSSLRKSESMKGPKPVTPSIPRLSKSYAEVTRQGLIPQQPSSPRAFCKRSDSNCDPSTPRPNSGIPGLVGDSSKSSRFSPGSVSGQPLANPFGPVTKPDLPKVDRTPRSQLAAQGLLRDPENLIYAQNYVYGDTWNKDAPWLKRGPGLPAGRQNNAPLTVDSDTTAQDQEERRRMDEIQDKLDGGKYGPMRKDSQWKTPAPGLHNIPNTEEQDKSAYHLRQQQSDFPTPYHPNSQSSGQILTQNRDHQYSGRPSSPRRDAGFIRYTTKEDPYNRNYIRKETWTENGQTRVAATGVFDANSMPRHSAHKLWSLKQDQSQFRAEPASDSTNKKEKNKVKTDNRKVTDLVRQTYDYDVKPKKANDKDEFPYAATGIKDQTGAGKLKGAERFGVTSVVPVPKSESQAEAALRKAAHEESERLAEKQNADNRNDPQWNPKWTDQKPITGTAVWNAHQLGYDHGGNEPDQYNLPSAPSSPIFDHSPPSAGEVTDMMQDMRLQDTPSKAPSQQPRPIGSSGDRKGKQPVKSSQDMPPDQGQQPADGGAAPASSLSDPSASNTGSPRRSARLNKNSKRSLNAEVIRRDFLQWLSKRDLAADTEYATRSIQDDALLDQLVW